MNGDITQLLGQIQRGDRLAENQLYPVIYGELRKIANAYLKRESSSHTLQPTALVNEAYLRLSKQNSTDWQNRAHFYGIAANLMRRILVDHARAKKAEKRGGKETCITLTDYLTPGEPNRDVDLVDLDQALNVLAKISDRAALVVSMKFFSGMPNEEIADALSVSLATVKREWTFAKAWLFDHLSENPS